MQKNPLALLFLFWGGRFFMTCMEPFRGVFVYRAFLLLKFSCFSRGNSATLP